MLSAYTMKQITRLPTSLRGGFAYVQCPQQSIPRLMQQSALSSKPRHFATSTAAPDGIAAPEIKFKDGKLGDPDDGEGKLFNARLVPTSASYFSAQPIFTDDLLSLQLLLQRFGHLPVLPPGEAPRVAWRSLAEYRNLVGETVKAAKYTKIVEILRKLNYIHPKVMPPEVKTALNDYKRDVNPYQNIVKVGKVNGSGFSLGVGRRKSSTARAWVVDGTGEVLVNGKTLTEAFGRIHDRESVIWAMKSTSRVDKYNIWALVSGGGTTGQAEALTLAVGKALLAHEPALKPALRRAGCMTRDPKRVERKKPGHVKARKMPAWVKR